MASGTFPEEYISPKEKEKEWYGLQYAKAMYYTNNRYGPQVFYDDSEYQSLIEVAQGRQSVDNIRNLFSFFRRNNGDAADDGSGSLAFIDIQVLNLAPKYINRAVAKMQQLKYDISLSAIDPTSIDEQKTMEDQVKALYELKGWFEQTRLDPKVFFPDLDIDALPEFSDELLQNIYINPKIQKVIDGELSIKLIQRINHFNQVMREVDWDFAVIGKAHIECYLDANGIPRPKRIPPNRYIGSYVENEAYQYQQYAGYYDIITVNQFMKEASEFLPMDKIVEIIQQYALKNSSERSFYMDRSDIKFDGLDYIPVLRFYFKSEDTETKVTKKNQYGNKILLDKTFDYVPPKETEARYGPGGDSRIIRNTYESIYGGTWVIDSECTYGYGRKEYPRMNLVECQLPIISFAPNLKEERVVSLLSQMIEPLYMINVTWNKIKQILARGWMGFREIDFNQLENVSLGRGGAVWTPRQVYEHFLKTDTLVKRGVTNKYDQPVGSAIEGNPTGLTLSDYFSTFTASINLLESMTGTTMVESSQPVDRPGLGVLQMSQQAGYLDMEYLFNAHANMYERVSHQLLLLMQQAKRNKKKIQGFIPALGKGSTQFYEVPDTLAYCEYGLIMEPQPTPEEWAGFYNDVSLAVKAGTEGLPGGISIADSALLRELDNLKQARQVMAIKQQLYERKVQQQKIADQEMAMKANQQAAEYKAKQELAKIEAKKLADLELAKLNGVINQALQNQKYEFEGALKNVEGMVKKQISKQQSVDEIIKQGVRNQPEDRKSERKLAGDVIKAETEKLKIEEMAKQKAKAKTPA